MRKNYVLVAALVTLILIGGLSAFLLDSFTVRQQEIVFETNGSASNETLNRTKRLGLVTDANMEFGEMPTEVEAIKFLNIGMPKKGILTISSTGNISRVLQFRDSYYFEGEKEVRVRFNASEPGYYSGNLKLKTQVPKDEMGSKWLDIKYYFSELF